MSTAYLGLGSNLGDRVRYLVEAIEALTRLDPHLRVSPIYETEPVGGPDGQDAYLNCVVAISTELTPEAVLVEAQHLESVAGRVRSERWGARTLDVDVLLVDDELRDDPFLTLPHPRMFERAFVLAPLADLDPDLVPGNWRDRFGGQAGVDAMVRRFEGGDSAAHDVLFGNERGLPWS